MELVNGGINTTSPTELLDVSRNIKCNGSLQTGNVSVIKGTSESDTATLFLATPYTCTVWPAGPRE